MNHPEMNHPETHPHFVTRYPKSCALGLKPVDAGPGFDMLELEKALGKDHYAALVTFLSDKSVFCCKHASYPKEHALAGYEVHCCYAYDLEKFLEAK